MMGVWGTVAGLPPPGLYRTAELVWSTQLQTFLTVLNSHSLSGKLEMMAFAPRPCSRNLCMHNLSL